MIKFIDAFCLTGTAQGALTILRKSLSQTQSSSDITFTLADLSSYSAEDGPCRELRHALSERASVGDVVIGLKPSGDASFDFVGRKIILWSGEINPLIDQLCKRYSLQKVSLN